MKFSGSDVIVAVSNILSTSLDASVIDELYEKQMKWMAVTLLKACVEGRKDDEVGAGVSAPIERSNALLVGVGTRGAVRKGGGLSAESVLH